MTGAAVVVAVAVAVAVAVLEVVDRVWLAVVETLAVEVVEVFGFVVWQRT